MSPRTTFQTCGNVEAAPNEGADLRPDARIVLELEVALSFAAGLRISSQMRRQPLLGIDIHAPKPQHAEQFAHPADSILRFESRAGIDPLDL